MAIIDSLNTLNTNLDNAKFKIAKNLKDKGVQALPSDKLDVLADKIVSIPSGSCNLQELSVTENGTYTPQAGDVKGYNKVTVNVPTGGGDQPFDFGSIGYSGNEEPMKSGLAYAQKIYNEWNPNETSLNSKFYHDNKLVYMPLVDTSKVTNMNYMFQYCKSLTTIPLLDTSKVTYMIDMFNSCNNLTTIPQLSTSNVTNMSGMFQFCSDLASIRELDTSKVTNMNNMFYSCSKLTTIPQLSTSNVTNMSGMFNSCNNLTTIPQLSTSKVTNMSDMFKYCGSLTTIPLLDTSKVTNMNNMFDGCPKLRYINIKNLGMQSAITKIDFLGYTYSPNKLIGIDGNGVTGCRQALVDTLLTNSFDRKTAGYSVCTIKLAPETKAVLTAEEISAIEAKGYTIVTA